MYAIRSYYAADELVEAEPEDEQQDRKPGPGIHRPAGEALGEGQPLAPLLADDPRITSYNVCYTKLLRAKYRVYFG